MSSFQYGETTIEWVFKADNKLKKHYVTVERGKPVVLRGPKANLKEQQVLIRYRARWIKQKLAEVNQQIKEEIVTGSRATYRGKSYYCQVEHCPECSDVEVSFNQSKLFVKTPVEGPVPLALFKSALDQFYHRQAIRKLGSRINYWQRETGLQATTWKVKKQVNRWANCTANDVLEFHPRSMIFSLAVMDYIIIHELCHTVEKHHDQSFWDLVSRHCPDWKQLHAEVESAGEMGL